MQSNMLRAGGWWLIAHVALVLLLGQAAFADQRTIVVPTIPKNLNLLKDSGLAARLLRLATTRAFEVETRTQENPLLSKFQRSADYRRWQIWFRTGLSFSSGQRIAPEDGQYSLQRCIKEALLPANLEVSVRPDPLNALGAPALELFFPHALSATEVGQVTALLKECPLLERISSLAFGGLLGDGSNLVASGLYQVVRFRSGSEYSLAALHPSVERPETIVLRAEDDIEQELGSLRIGKVDMLFGIGDEQAERIRQDPTLQLRACLGTTVAFRVGLVPNCDQPERLFESLGYSNE